MPLTRSGSLTVCTLWLMLSSNAATVAENGRRPVVSLDVIGVGFGRTGTLSLKLALERLGFAPCEHMINLHTERSRIALWLEAAHRKERGEPVDWSVLFAGYRATVDWPGVFFWRELITAFPIAKVVLTVRDPQRWYASASETILRLNEPRAADGSPLPLAPEVIERRKALDPLLDAVFYQGTLEGHAADRDLAIDIFTRHVADVQAEVPADRLLLFEVGQGWEPLCRFLGVPIPEGESFPHVNDSASFRERINRFVPSSTAQA
jgi:hypothetical protein